MGIFAIGNEELDAAPELEDGAEIVCPVCGGTHIVKYSYSEDSCTHLGFYKCGETYYLAAVHGKSVMEGE